MTYEMIIHDDIKGSHIRYIFNGLKIRFYFLK